MNNMEVIVTDSRVSLGENQLVIGTPGSAGYDISVWPDFPIVIHPGETRKIASGVKMHIRNPNLVGFLLSRSSVGTKQHLNIAQGTGVIDSDYQGEMFVVLRHNGHDGTDPVTIEPGMRVAQMVYLPAIQFESLVQVDEFSEETVRGSGGFGSTGLKHQSAQNRRWSEEDRQSMLKLRK